MANQVSFIIRLQDKYSAAAAKIARATDKVKRKVGGLRQKINKLQKSFTSLGKKAVKTGLIMSAALTLPILLLGKKLVDAASDAEETANKFKEVFKGLDKEGTAAVSKLASGFDVATSTVQELLSNTGDLLVGLGLTRAEALKMSVQVVALSADVASFKNIQGGAERASNALTKALLGEREMLKDTFKTSVLEAEVKKRAIVITRKNRKLTLQQAKALATLAIVTDRNKDSLGDYNRTSQAFANLSRKNSEATKELAEKFGKLLLPFAIKLIIVLTRIVDSISKLSPGMQKLILVFAGLLAIAGPLLIIVGAIAIAFGAISLPILGIVTAVGLVVAAFLWLLANWTDISNAISKTIDLIGVKFTNLWEGAKAGFKSFIDFVTPLIDILLLPFTAVLAVSKFIGSKFAASAPPANTVTSAITAPVAPIAASGSITGEITVSATQGARIENTKLQSRGAGLNVGMNVAGAL